MAANPQPVAILMAEDDPDDRLMVKDAFVESRVYNNLYFVEDGVQLMEYLRAQGEYAERESFPMPDLILLDLNMPRKDGREAIEEIKADPRLRHIPIVVLTTSKVEEDILRSYDTGAAGYICKPMTFEALVKVVQGLEEYWVQIVRLPANQSEETKSDKS